MWEVGKTLEIQEMDQDECQGPPRDDGRGCLRWAPVSSGTAGANTTSYLTIPGSRYWKGRWDLLNVVLGEELASVRTGQGKDSALLWYQTKLRIQVPCGQAFMVSHVTSRGQLRINQSEQPITLHSLPAGFSNPMYLFIYLFKILEDKGKFKLALACVLISSSFYFFSLSTLNQMISYQPVPVYLHVSYDYH